MEWFLHIYDTKYTLNFQIISKIFVSSTTIQDKNVSKNRIYKTAIRSILTYAAETRPETSENKKNIRDENSSKNSGKNTNG